MSSITPYKHTKLDLDLIIDRIASGEYQSTIAKELGITPSALCQRLRSVPELAQAKEQGIEQRLDQGLERLQNAVDKLHAVSDDGANLNLARVVQTKIQSSEAVLRRLEWRASVECPHRWSSTQRTELNVRHSYSTVLRTIDDAIESERVQEKEVGDADTSPT